jgi:hypothetical protein
MKQTFKVGDLVMLEDYSSAFYSLRHNHVYEVLKTDVSGRVKLIGFEVIGWISNEWLKLAPSKEKALQTVIMQLEKELNAVAEFKIGDIVEDCVTGDIDKVTEVFAYNVRLEKVGITSKSNVVYANPQQIIVYKIDQAKRELEQIKKDKEIKVGDYVVCVDALHSFDRLTQNQIYIVTNCRCGDFCLEGVHSSWMCNRFVKATQQQVNAYLAEKEANKPLLHSSTPTPDLELALDTLKELMQQEGTVTGYNVGGIEIYYAKKDGSISTCATGSTSLIPTFKNRDFADKAIIEIGEQRLKAMFLAFAGINV